MSLISRLSICVSRINGRMCIGNCGRTCETSVEDGTNPTLPATVMYLGRGGESYNSLSLVTMFFCNSRVWQKSCQSENVKQSHCFVGALSVAHAPHPPNGDVEH